MKIYSISLILGFALLFGGSNICAQDKQKPVPDEIKFLAEMQIVISKNMADSARAALVDSIMISHEYSWEDLNGIYRKRFRGNSENAVNNMQLIEQYLTDEMKKIQAAGEKKAFSDMEEKKQKERESSEGEK